MDDVDDSSKTPMADGSNRLMVKDVDGSWKKPIADGKPQWQMKYEDE